MENLVIFGDSYSTYEGYIPEKHAIYYPKLDVTDVENTWWKKFIKKSGYNLILNDSWSGSTICYTGWSGTDCSQSSSFIYRYRKLKNEGFFKENSIDNVIVFGATNDSWCEAPLGEIKFDNFSESDLYSVLPAICYFAKTLREDLPSAKITFVINTELKDAVSNAIKEACKRYGHTFVELVDITKESGHPTIKGMQEIVEQISSVIL